MANRSDKYFRASRGFAYIGAGVFLVLFFFDVVMPLALALLMTIGLGMLLDGAHHDHLRRLYEEDD